MRSPLTRKLAGFGTTIFTEMTRLANEHGAVNLAQGFPDFDGPMWLKEAAERAVREAHGQYARSAGHPALVEAIAQSIESMRGLSYDPMSEITVTCGATQAIHAAISAICDVGDEVILFEPFYDSYRACVCQAGATVRAVRLEAPDFALDRQALELAFSARTRAIVLNTPHNPTGKVFTREELSFIGELCQKHDVICIADEVYEHLVYTGEHVSIASLPGMRSRTITLSSLSKTFSFTGWRIGWAVADAPLTEAIRCAHQFSTFAAPTPMQIASVEALRVLARDSSYRDELLAEYRGRRELLMEALSSVGFDVIAPAGAFFVCAGFSRLGYADDVSLCRALVTQTKVAAIPRVPSSSSQHEGRAMCASCFVSVEKPSKRLCDGSKRLLLFMTLFDVTVNVTRY
ncbi:MAG: aminotransferase class I/II-fold pyridoxal phosphate-dependent enzyme [Polyangiaceae bacterium]